MIWVDIKGYEGFYKISKCGKVKSRYKCIKTCLAKNGYYVFNTSVNGKVKQHYLHRTIAKAFIKNPENRKCINHVDGNKVNNRIENLEWVTAKENNKHAIKCGLRVMPKGKSHCCYGKTRFEIFGN